MCDFGAWCPHPHPHPAPTIPAAALSPWPELTAVRPVVTPLRHGAVPPAGSQPCCGVMAPRRCLPMGAAAQPVQHRIPVVPPAWHDAGRRPLPLLLLAGCLGPTMAGLGSHRGSSSGFCCTQIGMQGIQGGGGSQPSTAAPGKGSFNLSRAGARWWQRIAVGHSSPTGTSTGTDPFAEEHPQPVSQQRLLLKPKHSKSPCFTRLAPAQTPSRQTDPLARAGVPGTCVPARLVLPNPHHLPEVPPGLKQAPLGLPWPFPPALPWRLQQRKYGGLHQGVSTPHIGGSLALRGIRGCATSVPHHSLVLLWQDR